MVRVRFVNTPDGKDVVAVAREGDNLMKVGGPVGRSFYWSLIWVAVCAVFYH